MTAWLAKGRGVKPLRGAGSIFIVVIPPFLDALAGIGQRQELIGDTKRHPLDHQPSDESHVAGQAVKLGEDHSAFQPARRDERWRQFGPTLDRITSLARLGLDLMD